MDTSSLNNIGHTILVSIQSIGYIPFAVMIIVDIILYRVHPVLGFLGTLFLFALTIGLIR